MARKRSLSRPAKVPAPLPEPEPVRPLAVLDMGASAIRLLIAEAPPDQPPRILEDLSRGVLLGKDTFTHGRITPTTMEATLRALEGFRRVMDEYGVVRYRAVATSAVREAQNRDAFLDRVRLRTGIDVEVIDGSEENRLSYIAVRDRMKDHAALAAGDTLMVEVGGGSADISFLRRGEPVQSGTFSLGAIRMRQSLSSWNGSRDQYARLLRRHILNVVDDIRREMPLKEAQHFLALGGDARFAAAQLLDGEAAGAVPEVPKEPFLALCEELSVFDVDQLIERYHLPLSEAETLVPALMAYRELLLETQAEKVVVPDASLRKGLLLDAIRPDEEGIESFRKQVLASAQALGERYHYDAAHGRQVALLSTRLFDQLRSEHGLSDRHRLLLEVAALLHDIGAYVNLRGHHKHSQYLLSVSEIFGLTREDLGLVSNVARYHRRALPQKSHLPYMALDRDGRLVVGKLGALLRAANALDADHLQKVTDVKLVVEDEGWVLELSGAGDLTMERLAGLARSDMLTEVFGRRVILREERQTRAWP